MVAPIIDGGKFINSAISTELSTANFERIITSPIPIKNFKATIVVLLFWIVSLDLVPSILRRKLPVNRPYYPAKGSFGQILILKFDHGVNRQIDR